MIKTLTNDDIIRGETKLEEFRHSDRINWNYIIDESWNDMIGHLAEMSYDLRQLCTKLSMSATYVRDYANRRIFVVEVTDHTDNADDEAVKLLGGATTTATGSQVAIVAINQTGFFKTHLTAFYKYYKLNASTNHTCYLIEGIYEDLHKLIARWYAYRDIAESTEDIYGQIADMYEKRYDEALSRANLKVDEDDSGDIDELEGDTDYQTIVFKP